MTISLLTSYISLMVIRKESNVQSCQQSCAKPKIKLQKNLVMPEGADKKYPYPENKVILTGGGHWSAEREKSARHVK